MRLEEELEQVRLSMEECQLEIKDDAMPGNEVDNAKDSLKIPTVVISPSPVKYMILKFEEILVFNISEVKKTDAGQIVKSPVKLLIEKYVSMKLENESTKNIIKYVQHDETEYGAEQVWAVLSPMILSAAAS